MGVHRTGSRGAAEARPPLRETAVAEVMTSTKVGAHPTAFTATGLPILRIALDVEEMTPVLRPLIMPLAANGVPPRLSHAKLLAYKQGNRGTIGYDVALGDASVTVLGKLYPQPGQVARVDAILRQLWQRAFHGSTDLGVPRPLGTVPELAMLLYVPVEGTPLDEVLALAGADPPTAIEQTGAWLARLHGSSLDLDRRLQLATEVVNLQAWAALVGRTHPEHAPAAARLAGALAATASVTAAAPPTPIHKDFHYKHVLVGSGVRVIDFDEVRLGDPMYDVAHFCAHLRLLACRTAPAATVIARSEAAFLRSYARHSGRAPTDSFAWYAAYTCLKIAKQLCSVRGVRPRPDGEEQVRQLAVMLQQGMAFHDLLR